MTKSFCLIAILCWLGAGAITALAAPKKVIPLEIVLISEPEGKRYSTGKEPLGSYHLEATLKTTGFVRAYSMNSAGQPFPLTQPVQGEAGKPVPKNAGVLSFEVSAKYQGRGGGVRTCLLALQNEKDFEAVPLNWEYLQKNGKCVEMEK